MFAKIVSKHMRHAKKSLYNGEIIKKILRSQFQYLLKTFLLSRWTRLIRFCHYTVKINLKLFRPTLNVSNVKIISCQIEIGES
jgi:hypothetical protein